MAVKGEELQVEAASEFLKNFANPTRLRLLCALSRSELSVGALAKAAGVPVVSASQQLAKLRRDGLVAARRSRPTIFYRLADENVSRLIEVLAASFCPSRPASPTKPKPQNPKETFRDPDPTPEKGF